MDEAQSQLLNDHITKIPLSTHRYCDLYQSYSHSVLAKHSPLMIMKPNSTYLFAQIRNENTHHNNQKANSTYSFAQISNEYQRKSPQIILRKFHSQHHTKNISSTNSLHLQNFTFHTHTVGLQQMRTVPSHQTLSSGQIFSQVTGKHKFFQVTCIYKFPQFRGV